MTFFFFDAKSLLGQHHSTKSFFMTSRRIRKAGNLVSTGLLILAGLALPVQAESTPGEKGGEPKLVSSSLETEKDTANQQSAVNTGSLVAAQSGDQQPGEGELPVTEKLPNTSRFSGNAGVDFRSQYNARGIVIQDQDLTIQPYLNLNYKLYEGKGFINGITATIGSWNDISTNTKLSNPSFSAKNWTETDINAGLSFQFADRFSFSSTFTNYSSPAGGYNEGRFINNILAYNDAGLISPLFSLQPQFTVLYELPADGYPGLKPNAWYFEPGLTPNYTFNPKSKYPINVALPLRVGLGNEFYNGSTYGFFSVGPQISFPLAFLNTPGTKWNLNLGYLYYNLGDTTTAVAPNRSSSQHLFNLGVSINF